jgi:hypothetical protein
MSTPSSSPAARRRCAGSTRWGAGRPCAPHEARNLLPRPRTRPGTGAERAAKPVTPLLAAPTGGAAARCLHRAGTQHNATLCRSPRSAPRMASTCRRAPSRCCTSAPTRCGSGAPAGRDRRRPLQAPFPPPPPPPPCLPRRHSCLNASSARAAGVQPPPPPPPASAAGAPAAGPQAERLVGKCVYVARTSAKGVAEKTVEQDLAVGEIQGSALDVFRSLVSDLYLPLLQVEPPTAAALAACRTTPAPGMRAPGGPALTLPLFIGGSPACCHPCWPAGPAAGAAGACGCHARIHGSWPRSIRVLRPCTATGADQLGQRARGAHQGVPVGRTQVLRGGRAPACLPGPLPAPSAAEACAGMTALACWHSRMPRPATCMCTSVPCQPGRRLRL